MSADFNGRFAQGLVKFEAVAAPTGVDARFSVLLRAGTSQSFKVSGFYVELYTEGGVQKSRMAVQADQFLVTSGNNRHYPMVFENGDPVRLKPDHAFCPFQLLIKERVARYGDQIPGARFPAFPQEA